MRIAGEKTNDRCAVTPSCVVHKVPCGPVKHADTKSHTPRNVILVRWPDGMELGAYVMTPPQMTVERSLTKVVKAVNTPSRG